MKKIADFGKEYTRKIEHIKKVTDVKHLSSAYLYIVEMNKTCKVCQSKAIQSNIKLHVSRKHLGRAAKEFAPTF
jgi:hypothetical protein